MSALTVIFLSSAATLTDSPRCPVLPPILILARKNYAKLLVLNTLSSTGLEQSIVKAWLTLVSAWSLEAFTRACLAAGALGYCVAIDK